MTRIDFYILDDATEHGREVYACRVVEKAYSLGHKVFLHSGSAAQAERMDELLWVYRDGSFIPHCLDHADAMAPVVIGCGSEPVQHTDILVNLADETPAFFGRFERVAEIVTQSPTDREQARQRFRYYRDRGYELQHHQVSHAGAAK